MPRLCRVVVEGRAFSASAGELLLDAALMNGVDIPFDCRSGYCGTCRVHVVKGRVIGGENDDSDGAAACQCRIISDLEVQLDSMPAVTTQPGRIARLTTLAPQVVEVAIRSRESTQYLPGQYFRLKFRGFPARCYSATVPLSMPQREGTIYFHIGVLPDGRVSSVLGRKIRAGHRVKLTGPLGSAHLRAGLRNRLILVAGGTGFAPIWSIADAAMREDYTRELVLIACAHRLQSLYMIEALCRLATCPNVTIIPVVADAQSISATIRTGRPTDYLPALSADDIVYTAGSPAMVDAVARIARRHGARCFTDPFEAAGTAQEMTTATRVARWFGGRPGNARLQASF